MHIYIITNTVPCKSIPNAVAFRPSVAPLKFDRTYVLKMSLTTKKKRMNKTIMDLNEFGSKTSDSPEPSDLSSDRFTSSFKSNDILVGSCDKFFLVYYTKRI